MESILVIIRMEHFSLQDFIKMGSEQENGNIMRMEF